MTRKKLIRLHLVIVMALLVSAILASTALAAPPAQDERPPTNGGQPGGGGTGGAGSGNGNGTGLTDQTCAAFKGQVLNWGFGPEANVGVSLHTGSWQVATTSASDGSYGFGGLGVGAARLHVALAPGQIDTLRPLVQDVGVYLNCDFTTIANVAVYSGPAIQPPATISMDAPGVLSAKSQIPLRLIVKNTLPNDISQVAVTVLLPPGVRAVDVKAAAASIIKIVSVDDGSQMAVVYLDRVASGATANIFVTVTAALDAPAGKSLRSTAALFYAESALHQAQLDFVVGQAAIAPPEEAPLAAPQAAVETAPEPAPTEESSPVVETAPTADSAEAFVPPPGQMPTTGDDFVPPGLLPTTGDNFIPPALLPETGLGLLLPLSGLGLLGMAFVAHLLRRSRS